MGWAAREMRRLVGKAIHSRNMLEDGDRLLVAVSGGKDSLSLLWLLRERLRRIPIHYEIVAVHADPGFGADSAGRMAAFFEEHGFFYRVIQGDFGPRATGPRTGRTPASSARVCGGRPSSRRRGIFAATRSPSATTRTT